MTLEKLQCLCVTLTEVVWGRLYLLEDRRQAAAIPSSNQLHLVQKVEEWWKLVLESTKETWKGSSAQVATHLLCKFLLWSCLEGMQQPAQPLFTFPHSQVGDRFSWLCLSQMPCTLSWNPDVGEIGNYYSIGNQFLT